MGGLLFKATLNQRRHFCSYFPIFTTWSHLGLEISCSFRQRLQYPHFLGPGRPNSVGTYHTHILIKLWMLLLFWKVPIRLLSGPFSACKAGSEAFLEMGTTEGKVPQSSLREERNLAASFRSHKNQLRLTNIRGPIKKYGKTAKFVFLEKINKIAFKYNGTPKNWP